MISGYTYCIQEADNEPTVVSQNYVKTFKSLQKQLKENNKTNQK